MDTDATKPGAWFLPFLIAAAWIIVDKLILPFAHWALSQKNRFADKVALIVAHPDDEAMFFTPTLCTLRSQGTRLHVLCLSTGDADGLGHLRRVEMERSCQSWDVAPEDFVILDVPELPDGFHSWNEDAVARHVKSFLDSRSIEVVITFDGYGVSGHPNHISTFRGCMKAVQEMDTRTTELFILDSVSFFQKYSGVLDLAFVAAKGTSKTFAACRLCACLQALKMHSSQLVWYRYIFAVLSRYAYVNTYYKVPLDRRE
eukprot:gnl/MRDRNA2_/MRDRNA2_16070_c0_seq2.p1 gnl/MRDRNA2_/MRDRNA2_16070_c0~~gnl/MRDRNA2_/MRDRNA2_16070_c0_seq2.p1  ORF type:complete len:273 (+),score=45.65 gnl/MRDRNA2_/MRDRNA2_16070_c0_seq2:47-820(+)